ncbi:hypothetical protein SODG_001941 [Sodalis praecaptivus]|nr:hypothetical protein NVIRENTERO_03241 [Sodalis praecaptivus]
MVIAIDFDYVSRCSFWSVHLRAGDGNILPLATLAHARRRTRRRSGSPQAGERLPLRRRFARTYGPLGINGPLDVRQRKRGEVCDG